MKISVVLLLLMTAGLRAEPEYPKMGPDIYDPQADGMAQIAGAVSLAKASNKHVLIDLGANWCIWCRRLRDTFHGNEAVADELAGNYVLVLIDVNHRQGKKRNDAVNDRFGNPMKEGLPVLVVLDADGRQLTTQETGALENGKDGHDPARVLAFLQKWAPPR